MGAGNVALAFTYWTALDDRSFRVLCRMALVSMDNGKPPRYFAGRDDLALALGKALPAKPSDSDDSPEAEAARKARASVYEVVRKAVARLVKAGVIVSSGDARFRNRAEYSLHLTPANQTQQNVAPATNESLPQETQQIVAPMTQQNVAPMTQQIVATDPTDCCPLGVEEELEEGLIGTTLGSNPSHAVTSPTETENSEQRETDIAPVEKPSSKAALAKQMAEDFTDWYQAYPKHVGRGAATNAYTKARKNGATAEELIAGARRYAAERKGEDPKFTAQAATWLNQERWADDPTYTGEIDVDAVLGNDYWVPGTPPEGLSITEEISWKLERRSEHQAERLAEAKAKVAGKPLSPWDPEYHRDRAPHMDHSARGLAKGRELLAKYDAEHGGYHQPATVAPQYAWANQASADEPAQDLVPIEGELVSTRTVDGSQEVLEYFSEALTAGGVKHRADGSWIRAAEALIRDDGYTVPQIQYVIRFATTNTFWRSNILTLPQLRGKFEQLKLKARDQDVIDMTPAERRREESQRVLWNGMHSNQENPPPYSRQAWEEYMKETGFGSLGTTQPAIEGKAS